MRLLEYTARPRAPYAFTPHLERFGIPGEPTPHVYEARGRSCRRLVLAGGEPVAVKSFFEGEPDDPHVRVAVYARSEDLAGRVTGQVFKSLRVDFDYNEFLEAVKPYDAIYRLALKYRGLRPGRSFSLYEALVDSIVKQRVALKAALRVMARLTRAYGIELSVGGESFHSFPIAERLAEAILEELRGYGLTRLKAKALREVAVREAEGSLPSVEEAIGDPELTVKELTRIRGVGRWTAELSVAIVHPRFPLGPSTDLAVTRGLKLLLGLEVRPGELRGALGDYAGLVMYLAAFDYEELKKAKYRAQRNRLKSKSKGM
ncbi:MAG: hypothetical protein F7B17_00560 [Desulfurococcales archaeon]|nr:hypothetical protein [Desulfurococcales archaeon]